ncbi:chromatin target of PRMT1 protein-like isoform X1 [Cyprinus carpio]|uniref:Chromatin target of PRMT1 protein-like isoform X1 n=1 Tax=Cyprinus carpio TaxID=7962 RepID=A0A9R0AFR0_CYPCA|nr:chromatin target of PRMT1 protein-like isoform X1 [Cyprinus carpio]XP_042597070.1 chromatin target of PRMT1 protein-like isoform X1 [Cyprinus carpio]XP_042597071.1 chromatin target of PRMT1 protein-like isoform X1 [Cyprinus carpio]
MDITAAVNQQTAASLKNQRLALEMADRPSVLAALHNTSNINNQLCKVSVKARLGCPMGRGGMMELRGQKRGGGGGGRRGLVKGFYTRKIGVQKGWSQQQHGGIVNWTGPVGNRGGGAIRKTEGNTEQQVPRPGTPQGGGRYTSVSRARSGCSRARFDSHQIASREQLDKQLDEYMSMTKSHMDAELDAYMAEVDLGDSV